MKLISHYHRSLQEGGAEGGSRIKDIKGQRLALQQIALHRLSRQTSSIAPTGICEGKRAEADSRREDDRLQLNEKKNNNVK